MDPTTEEFDVVRYELLSYCGDCGRFLGLDSYNEQHLAEAKMMLLMERPTMNPCSLCGGVVGRWTIVKVEEKRTQLLKKQSKE